jgi:hypothetical protein
MTARDFAALRNQGFAVSFAPPMTDSQIARAQAGNSKLVETVVARESRRLQRLAMIARRKATQTQ